jgi:hypothetical protein
MVLELEQNTYNIYKQDRGDMSKTKVSRPERLLSDFERDFQRALPEIEKFKAGKGRDLPAWPDWCFLPVAGWYALTCLVLGKPRLGVGDTLLISKTAALGTWRYSKGIYKFDKSLAQALAETKISGDIPSDALYRLPEACIYIDLIDSGIFPATVYGAFVYLEFDVNDGSKELRFLFDTESGLLPVALRIGAWSVEAGLNKIAQSAWRQGFPVAGAKPEETEFISKLLSLVLYLCSEGPELEPSPGAGSKYKSEKHSSARLIIPEKTKVISVGEKIGAQLRTAADATGKTVAPHIRRGHWHGFWRGPRDGAREFFYKWLPPMVVAAE